MMNCAAFWHEEGSRFVCGEGVLAKKGSSSERSTELFGTRTKTKNNWLSKRGEALTARTSPLSITRPRSSVHRSPPVLINNLICTLNHMKSDGSALQQVRPWKNSVAPMTDQ